MDEELELNTLHRLRKHSGRLILEEHGSCEVPAGCGGLVLRWLNPAQECYLLFTVFPRRPLQLFLDGIRLQSSAVTVPVGRHVLAAHFAESALFMLAVLKNTKPEQALLLSAADGSWRGTNQKPPDHWAHPDFPESWQPLPQVPYTDKDWQFQTLDKLGACPLGLACGPLWVRREFEVLP